MNRKRKINSAKENNCTSLIPLVNITATRKNIKKINACVVKEFVVEKEVHSKVNYTNCTLAKNGKDPNSDFGFKLPKVTVTLIDIFKYKLKRSYYGENLCQNNSLEEIMLQNESNHINNITSNSNVVKSKYQSLRNSTMTEELNPEKNLKNKETTIEQSRTWSLRKRKEKTDTKTPLSNKGQTNGEMLKDKISLNTSSFNSKLNLQNYIKNNEGNTPNKKSNENISVISDYAKKLKILLGPTVIKALKRKNVLTEFLNITWDIFCISTYPKKENTLLKVLKNNKDEVIKVEVEFTNKEKISLATIFGDIMNNHKCSTSEIVNCLKERMCINCLKCNYIYTQDHQSPYKHSRNCIFFEMNKYSYEVIMGIVIVMRNDVLFVHAIRVALKILSEERKSLLWTTTLVFFVYCVSDPSEKNLLEFWIDAAKFFCDSNIGSQISDGVSCLLHIFREGGHVEHLKIYKFLQTIKEIPFSLSYNLLQPVLKMNLPSQFLIEAVKASLETEVDVLKVYQEIVPLITFETMSLDVVDLLLKFCKLLETLFPKNSTFDFCQKLQAKKEQTRFGWKNQISHLFKNCQFVSLNIFLNHLELDTLTPAADYILTLLFDMKISPDKVVYLMKLTLKYSSGEKSRNVLARIIVTLILNLVQVKEWEIAYKMLSLCNKNQINLIQAEASSLLGFSTISEFRIALLLVEIFIYKEKYKKAMCLIKKYHLYSSNHLLYELSWRENDDNVRIQIIEKLFDRSLSNLEIEIPHELFMLIYTEQKRLQGPLDLTKYIDDILILLLNQDSEVAIEIYQKIHSDVMLKDITVRGILVTMVRNNKLKEAKSLIMSLNQNVYILPDVPFSLDEPIIITICNGWLEEEIYVIFDKIFDIMAGAEFQKKNLNVRTKISDSKLDSSFNNSSVPVCLSLAKDSYRDVARRIIRVLKTKFSPSILLKATSKILKLDSSTLQSHLHLRNQS